MAAGSISENVAEFMVFKVTSGQSFMHNYPPYTSSRIRSLIRKLTMKRSNEDARSSQIFFTARVKNKREDTKLRYELKQLERQFGHTIFNIHKEIRDLKSELKITKRSSGRSSEGWFSTEDDDQIGMSSSSSSSHRASSTNSTSLRRRGRSFGHHRNQKRVFSAPADGEARKQSVGVRVTKDSEQDIRVESPRVSGTLSKSKGKAIVTQNQGIRPPATTIIVQTEHMNVEKRNGEYTSLQSTTNSRKETLDIGGHEKIIVQSLNKEHVQKSVINDSTRDIEEARVHSGYADIQPNLNLTRKNSWLKAVQRSTPVQESVENIFLESDKKQRDDVEVAQLPENIMESLLSPKMTEYVKERWLKPALKKERVDDDVRHDKPKKTVRIASLSSNARNSSASSRASVRDDNAAAPSKRNEENVPAPSQRTATFLTEPTALTPTLSATGIPASVSIFSKPLPTDGAKTPRPKSANVIPDVRKKVLSAEELELKKKRDNLLACSVSALLSGKQFTKPKTSGISEQGENDDRRSSISSTTGEGDGSPVQRRRFSFRSISMLALTQHKAMPVEKKATLGSRLKLKTPAEESEQRKIDIKKSVQVNDSDSDDDTKMDFATPPKPAIDLKNVKSKISNQWKQDVALDKPPTLASDTHQLQRSLAAAHISRERDLRLMQGENDVNPMKVIDGDRQSALMIKFKAFNDNLAGGSSQENRRKSVIDAIHAGTEGKQILKLMRLVNRY